jgi:hypothetical protein
MHGIAAYVSFSELTGQPVTAEDLTHVLAEIPRVPAFLFLCKVGTALSLFELPDLRAKLNDARGSLLVTLLDDELLGALRTKPIDRAEDVFHSIRHHGGYNAFEHRPVFHKQQILYTMKRVLLDAPDTASFEHDLTKQEMYTLGRACLMVNDLLYTDAQDARTPSLPPETDEKRTEVGRELLAQLLPGFELNKTRLFTTALAESWILISMFRSDPPVGFSQEGHTLDDLFRSQTGLDLETYFTLVTFNMATFIGLRFDDLMANQEKFNINESTHFRKLDFDRSEIERVYDSLRRSPSDYREAFESDRDTTPFLDQFNFLPFHTYPIVSINPPISTPIDANVLAQKMSSGLYHTLLNNLPNDEVTRFFVAWGDVFERYVNMLFEYVYEDSQTVFFTEQPFNGLRPETLGFDGFLDGGRTVVAMEYKGGYLNATKYKDNAAALWAAIDKKYGTAKGAGVEQLVRKIALLFSRDATVRRSFGSYNPRKAREVYPVLIVQETALEIPIAQILLEEAFNQSLDRSVVDDRVNVHPLTLLSIDDLQSVLPNIAAGDFSLRRILDYYYEIRGYDPSLTFQSVLRRYYTHSGLRSRDNPWIEHDFHLIMDELRSHFVDRTDDEE